MAEISIQHLTKRYGEDNAAVDDVSLEIADGEFMILVGPSGSGKSTLLQMIVGLLDISEGDLYIGGERMNEKAPRDRDLAMVFQNYALYPHLTVFEHIAFPLRLRHVADDEIRRRVEETASTLQLTDFLDRKPANLSGGQRQRVAMGRAVVRDAHAYLFDEPLSNLDAKLREEMRFELKRLQRELGITGVYVTHDQVEALAMSNRVAVMRDGKIEQVGAPREVYERPGSKFVADFIGTSNFIDGVVEAREGASYRISTEHGVLDVPSDADFAVGAAVVVAARPEHIELAPGVNGSGPNVWLGRIEVRSFLGEVVDHVVSVGSREVRARCNSRSRSPRRPT